MNLGENLSKQTRITAATDDELTKECQLSEKMVLTASGFWQEKV